MGDAPAAAITAGIIDSNHTDLRRAAAQALAWTTPANDTQALHAALRRSDTEVKHAAALGLAWLGDPSGLSVLTPPPPPPAGRRRATRKRASAKTAQLPADGALFAALVLDERDRIPAALDSDDHKIRALALRLILMIEWREGDAVTDWCLAALDRRAAGWPSRRCARDLERRARARRLARPAQRRSAVQRARQGPAACRRSHSADCHCGSADGALRR
ncbi:MAG: hypothetical protein ACI9U2_004618 [Bradymonadia bacterium]